MYREVFPERATQDAKVTIEVGDYKVTMSGKLSPPELESFSKRDDIFALQPDVYKNIHFNMVPRSEILIERVRWTIPIAIRPRIEK